MVSRLGQRFPAASLRGLLFPIVQTVVVEHQIAKLSSHEDYAEMRTASPDTEFALLQKMQETLQKNLSNFRKDMSAMILKFFQDDTLCSMQNHVKFETFGVVAGNYQRRPRYRSGMYASSEKGVRVRIRP